MPEFSMIEVSMALSILGGWLSYEFLGFSPGGIVTAGYLALYIQQPTRIAGTLLVSAITCIAVRLCSRIMMLYGRKRFAFTMLIGFLVGWAWDGMAAQVIISSQELRVIGLIVPGLIANDLEKQGPVGTISSLVVVVAFVRLGILGIRFFVGSL